MLAYLKKTYGGSQKDFFSDMKEVLQREEKKFIITANPETFMMAQNHELLHKAILDPETIVIPDGIGVVKALRFAKLPVTERVPGVEFSEFLLEQANAMGKTICLFGASQEVMEAFLQKFRDHYPRIHVAGAYHGYHKDRDGIFDQIAEKKPDIVLVALGIPEQESLIYRRLSDFDKGIFVGVGGTFDVLSGVKKRAPAFFIKLNLEWLYRIGKEPKRFKRFFNSNVKFFSIIRRECREEKRREKD